MTARHSSARRATRRGVLAGTALLAAPALVPSARAQGAAAYPSRPVRIVVPYAPGGSTDLLARIVAERIAPELGQPVVVENRPGGGAIIGSEAVARAASDGHTLLMATNGSHAINVAIFRNLPYDPVRDFAPVTIVASVPLVLVVAPNFPATSPQELIAQLRARPGQYSFGSAGTGASGHLAGEMLKRLAGLDLVHVPYRGDGPSLADLIGGRLTMSFANLPAAIGFVRAGTLRALAVSAGTRSPALPDLPTLRESGLPDFEVDPWYGLMAPAGTPPARIARLQSLVAAALALPAVREQLAGLGAQPVGSTPDAFAATLRADIARYVQVARAANIEVN